MDAQPIRWTVYIYIFLYAARRPTVHTTQNPINCILCCSAHFITIDFLASRSFASFISLFTHKFHILRLKLYYHRCTPSSCFPYMNRFFYKRIITYDELLYAKIIMCADQMHHRFNRYWDLQVKWCIMWLWICPNARTHTHTEMYNGTQTFSHHENAQQSKDHKRFVYFQYIKYQFFLYNFDALPSWSSKHAVRRTKSNRNRFTIFNFV